MLTIESSEIKLNFETHFWNTICINTIFVHLLLGTNPLFILKAIFCFSNSNLFRKIIQWLDGNSHKQLLNFNFYNRRWHFLIFNARFEQFTIVIIKSTPSITRWPNLFFLFYNPICGIYFLQYVKEKFRMSMVVVFEKYM